MHRLSILIVDRTVPDLGDIARLQQKGKCVNTGDTLLLLYHLQYRKVSNQIINERNQLAAGFIEDILY